MLVPVVVVGRSLVKYAVPDQQQQQQQTSMEVRVAMKAVGALLNLLAMEELLEVELRDWRVHKVVGRCLY